MPPPQYPRQKLQANTIHSSKKKNALEKKNWWTGNSSLIQREQATQKSATKRVQ